MRKLLLAMLVIGNVFVSGVLLGQADRESEGDKPYIPTRLEWLAVSLNASGKNHPTEERPFSLQFVPTADDTLTIHVRYFPRVRREELNRYIDTARKIAGLASKSHGWDKWLKIREDVGEFGSD